METKFNKLNDYMGTEIVNPLLTDFYQYSMIYAHWKNKRHESQAVFDCYFRKCPFNLNSCIFGGLDECLEFLKNFKFTEGHINYLKQQLPQAEEEFFSYLSKLDMSDIKVYGFENCDFVIPNEPLLTIEGTLDKVQLIETTLLNLTNYPSLISSLTFRLRGLFKNKLLIEDGSIYAQSPNGGLLGVKYAIAATVDKTTNLLGGKYFNLPLFFKNPELDENLLSLLTDDEFILNGKNVLFKIKEEIGDKQFSKYSDVLKQQVIPIIMFSNNEKLPPFIYEIKKSDNLQEQIEIFTLINSALKWAEGETRENMIILNYPHSVDDSKQLKELLNFKLIKDFKLYIKYNPFKQDITYETNEEFYDGVILGPEFIVSSTQPALGMVYKINQIEGRPCMKFSEEKGKQTIPGFKTIIRLFSEKEIPIADFMCLREESDTYLNTLTFDAYLHNEMTEKHKIEFSYSKVMNNLIFSEGKVQYSQLNVMQLSDKVRESHSKYFGNNLKLYISESIRQIIVDETTKLQELSK